MRFSKASLSVLSSESLRRVRAFAMAHSVSFNSVAVMEPDTLEWIVWDVTDLLSDREF